MRKHKIHCWHVHVVSSLIHVNQESLGASSAINASRKHCLVNNTNVGQCQQLMTVNHVDLEAQLSYRVSTSAGPKEGLLATRAYVGVNAHIATREVWKKG